MGKTANCIKMLQILSSGKVYGRNELAELLGTNARNIVEYKKELEDASWAENEGEYAMGYHIFSFSGKGGGYQLDKNVNIPTIKLTPSEKIAFSEGLSYLDAAKNFVFKKQFKLAVSKINSGISNYTSEENTTNIVTQPLLRSDDEIISRYNTIRDSIDRTIRCEILFLSADNVERTRLVDFYDLFLYNGAWFGIGYCHMANAVRYFKFTRIVSIRRTSERFRRPSKNIYNPSDYYDENGFKVGLDWSTDSNNMEWNHIKLRLSGRPAMYVKEYRYGKNQTIQAIDKDTTILECDMQYCYNTIKFVMGFGVDCEVLEPEWLKEEVKEQCKKMLEKLNQ